MGHSQVGAETCRILSLIELQDNEWGHNNTFHNQTFYVALFFVLEIYSSQSSSQLRRSSLWFLKSLIPDEFMHFDLPNPINDTLRPFASQRILAKGNWISHCTRCISDPEPAPEDDVSSCPQLEAPNWEEETLHSLTKNVYTASSVPIHVVIFLLIFWNNHLFFFETVSRCWNCQYGRIFQVCFVHHNGLTMQFPPFNFQYLVCSNHFALLLQSISLFSFLL